MGTDERLARFAHDLKAPLTVIIGYASLLRTRDDEAFRQKASIAILQAAQQLSNALDELFDMLPPRAPQLDPDATTKAVVRSVEGERKQVLIVDDDETVRRLLQSTLPKDQFDVLEAADGDAGLQLADSSSSVLVLLDWHLPGRSGAHTLGQLKSRLPDRPVIVLTAEHDPQQHQLAQELGADLVLTKPFSPLQLLQTVEELLHEHTS